MHLDGTDHHVDMPDGVGQGDHTVTLEKHHAQLGRGRFVPGSGAGCYQHNQVQVQVQVQH